MRRSNARCSMGEIKVNIPKEMEAAFEKAFPGEDKAVALLRLIQAEIARRQDIGAVAERSFEDIVDEVLRLREEPPYFTDDDIRKARQELRQ
jgi:hypothetical protein